MKQAIPAHAAAKSTLFPVFLAQGPNGRKMFLLRGHQPFNRKLTARTPLVAPTELNHQIKTEPGTTTPLEQKPVAQSALNTETNAPGLS